MTYAVIETGGKQHKVEEGEIITIEKLDLGEGEKVEFSDVLAVKNNDKLNTTPTQKHMKKDGSKNAISTKT